MYKMQVVTSKCHWLYNNFQKQKSAAVRINYHEFFLLWLKNLNILDKHKRLFWTHGKNFLNYSKGILLDEKFTFTTNKVIYWSNFYFHCLKAKTTRRRKSLKTSLRILTFCWLLLIYYYISYKIDFDCWTLESQKYLQE